MNLEKTLSPRQVAQAIGASEASLKRWCDKGLIPFHRTHGGHRRMRISDVVQFLRDNDMPLPRPEILGLPSGTGDSKLSLERSKLNIIDALKRSDAAVFRQTGLNLYLAGHSVAEICDRVIAPAFHEIGDFWEHGDLEIYQERRGAEICMEFLIELRNMLPDIPEDAPYALGGTVLNDPYVLPSLMVEVTLREIGWNAEYYGTGLTIPTFIAAIRDRRPRLVFLSASFIKLTPDTQAELETLFEAAQECGAALVAGGRALTEDVRKRLKYTAYCDDMAHLVTFARALHHPPAA